MIKSESLGKDYWVEGGANDYVVKVEYNYVHDYGVGITNDYAGIKIGSKSKTCGIVDEAGLEQSCYTYVRIYNNLITNGLPYFCCAWSIYSDNSCSKNLYEKNLIYGAGSEL